MSIEKSSQHFICHKIMQRRIKKPVVQLTSLMDLLFIMIFLSLLQTKTPVTEVVQETSAPPSPPPPPQTIEVNAIFHFYPVSSNTEAQEGSFLMGGKYEKEEGEIRLGGVSWITRPEGYDMVPLMGQIDLQNNTLTGQIDFAGCEEFTLKRIEKLSGSPISGKWKGKYRCLQGETGLTLTIH